MGRYWVGFSDGVPDLHSDGLPVRPNSYSG
jgi:hypothetical protein